MAIYCISDLHGRFDLFSMILDKIKFDHSKDTLYFLGDAVDGAYGGIKIIRYMMKHKDSCVFIEGNHENFFLSQISLYDIIMSDIKLKQAIVEIGKHPTVFNELYDKIVYKLSDILTSDKVYEWLQQGNIKQRKALLDALKEFTKINGHSINEFTPVLLQMNKQFKTREFINELVQIDYDEYNEIKKYLSDSPKNISLYVNGRHFELMHSIGCISFNKCIILKRSTDTYYIYGHDPIPKLHRKINGIPNMPYFISTNANILNFDYRKIFSFVDANNNYYYDIDTASNPVCALRLDDMSEFYVGIPSLKKDSGYQKVPDDIIEYKSAHYEKYDYPITIGKYSFKRHTKSRFVIVTFKGNSYEYLIAVDKTNGKIYYTRISWLNIRSYFIIDNIDIRQASIDDIIKIVNEHSKTIEIPDEYLYEKSLD